MTPADAQKLVESSTRLVGDYGALQAMFGFAIVAGGAAVVFVGFVFWRMFNTILHGRDDVAGISTIGAKVDGVVSTQAVHGHRLDDIEAAQAEQGHRIDAIYSDGCSQLAAHLAPQGAKA